MRPWRIRTIEDYKKAYKEAVEDPSRFWGSVAEDFTWDKKWSSVVEQDFESARVEWFKDAKLNITTNCLDRHAAQNPDKTALLFAANDPALPPVRFSFAELKNQVEAASSAFSELGVVAGDRVCLYMGMTPELVISVLACARIGAIHSVVFGGFSAKALSERIRDAECSLLICSDVGLRGDKEIPLKELADEALLDCDCVKKVVVHQRGKKAPSLKKDRDVLWGDIVVLGKTFDPVPRGAEDPLFILYTSGSTGRPKGIQHTCGGYMVWAQYTFENVFQPQKDSIFWCTADVGWITGHTYLTYGPLLAGTTTVMFEGVPSWPDAGRFWQVVDQLGVTHFYTAPTAIRALEAKDHAFVEKSSRKTLEVLGTVGEPINLEAWEWYHEKVGEKKCPIMDTWWQTETGGIMISSLAGVTPTKACFATAPLPGVVPELVSEKGDAVTGNPAEGNLILKQAWPGMARTIWGDHERFQQTYFSAYPGNYFTGDGAKRDDEGLYRITGRVDDVINVSGHRLGTAEIEDAINEHDDVVESAVVGYPHDIKGAGIYAYVVRYSQEKDATNLGQEILSVVQKMIGPIAKPDKIVLVDGLPKTRSGKIMRRILRKMAEGEFSQFGDTSTLLNPEIVEHIKTKVQESLS